MNVPKLRFKEFNDEWVENEIRDFGNIITGNTPPTNQKENYGNDFLWVSPIDLGKFKYVSDTKTKLSFKGFEKTRHIQKESILVTCIGSTIGKMGMASTEMSTNQQINSIICNDYFDSNYIYYGINFNFPKFLKKISFQAVPIISKSEFEKLKLKISPNKKEQEKIGTFLSLVDKKIEFQSKKIEALKLYKKGLYQLYFSNNSRNCKEIPLKNICEITTGKLDANAMAKNGKYRFYTCAKDYYYIDEYAFDTEALLISGNGAYVGYIHYYKGKFNAYQRTYVLTNFKYNIKYIKYYLDCFLSKRINSEKKEGNTPYIVMGTLSNMNIKLPSEEEQERISSNFDLLTDKINLEEIKLNKLESLKKGLMQNMFV